MTPRNLNQAEQRVVNNVEENNRLAKKFPSLKKYTENDTIIHYTTGPTDSSLRADSTVSTIDSIAFDSVLQLYNQTLQELKTTVEEAEVERHTDETRTTRKRREFRSRLSKKELQDQRDRLAQRLQRLKEKLRRGATKKKEIFFQDRNLKIHLIETGSTTTANYTIKRKKGKKKVKIKPKIVKVCRVGFFKGLFTLSCETAKAIIVVAFFVLGVLLFFTIRK